MRRIAIDKGYLDRVDVGMMEIENLVLLSVMELILHTLTPQFGNSLSKQVIVSNSPIRITIKISKF